MGGAERNEAGRPLEAALAIEGATLVDPVLGVVEEALLLADPARILWVGPRAEAPAWRLRPEGERVEARGRFLMPGMVNAHSHAAMTLMRGYADDLSLMPWLETRIFPVEARLRPEDTYWGALLAAVEMLEAGVTAFADMYFFMEETARAVVEAGGRAAIARGMVEPGDGSGARALAEAEALFRDWHGAAGGRIRVMLGPHGVYTTTRDFLGRVADRAAALGARVHIHLSENDDENEQSRAKYGKSPAEVCAETGLFQVGCLAAHCVRVGPGDIELLAEHRVGVAHNPVSNLKLASGIAPVVEMRRAGVTVGLGTDGAASTNRLEMFEEMRLASILQKARLGDAAALPAREAFAMATLESARALGWADEIGSLEPGKACDAVLVDPDRSPALWPRFDPFSALVYSAEPAAVEAVWVGGRKVVEDGRVRTVDVERLRREVSRRAALLTREAG